MMEQARVTRMRRLLSEATPASLVPFDRYVGVPGRGIVDGPLRRRALVKQVMLAARHYGLQLDVDAYVAAAGCASVAGLDNEQLQRLAAWIGDVMDRMATACDAVDAPPAR